MPFFLNFIQALLSIVSFCVRDVFNFQLTNREELSSNLYLYDSIPCFDRYCFLGVLTLINLLAFLNFGMGSFIYNILFTLLPFHGSFAVTP